MVISCCSSFQQNWHYNADIISKLGMQDCGKPYYVENYNKFNEAIGAHYPSIELIANCDLGYAAPTKIYDWHYYSDAPTMFAMNTNFDPVPRGPGHPDIFASEYAVFEWNENPAMPYGNLEVRITRAAAKFLWRK